MTLKMKFVQVSLRAAALTVALASLGGVTPFAGLSPGMARAQSAPVVASVSDVKSLLSPTLPRDAKEITVAMKAAKTGEAITVHGHVAMSKDAFIENRAMFTLVDESTRKGCCPPSDELPDTACDIPAEGRATIQIVDAHGRPLRFGLLGEHGLEPGAEVFVTGKVQMANGTDALVIDVLSMHVPRAPLPSGFFLGEQPENAKDVSQARTAGAMKAGEKVILRGRIGGSTDPFVGGRAVFTLVGRGLKACNENPDDHCAEPWDYCCETNEDIMANSVTIQVVDPKGQILRTDMKGRHGMKELSEIVVVGKVSTANAKVVVVDATSVFIVRE